MIVFLEAQGTNAFNRFLLDSLQASNIQEYLTLIPGYGKRN